MTRWGNIVFLFIFLAVYAWASFKEQRGWEEPPEEKKSREKTLGAAAWLFLGWALHYIPFWTMGRVLYVHHYYPALLFSSMLTGVLIDHLLEKVFLLPLNSYFQMKLHLKIFNVTDVLCLSSIPLRNDPTHNPW